MITVLAYPEDIVSDVCDEAPPTGGMGPTILDVGLRPERQFSEDDDEGCLNWGETITEIDVDLAAGEESPDTIKPRHQSFGLDELRNVERHIDLDLLPQDVLSEIADEVQLTPAPARQNLQFLQPLPLPL